MELHVCTGLCDGPWSPEEWNALAATSETNTVFQTHQWHAAWWRTYGNGFEPVVVVGLEDGRPVGIAPLMRTGSGRGSRLSLIGEGRSDYQDVIVSSERKESFLAALVSLFAGCRGEWGEISLANVPASSATIPLALGLTRRHRLPSLMRRDTVNHALLVSGSEEEAREIMKKQDLRRRTNYLRRTGALRYFNIDDPSTAERYLALFFDQHVERWHSTRSRSLFENAINRQFYDELVRCLMPTGWLLWSVLEFDGCPIAFHFGFEYDGVITWYKPSFDIEYAKRSPGKVLLRHLIGYAIEKHAVELDFTVGDERFKRRFKNRTRMSRNVSIYSDSSAMMRHTIARGVRGATRLLGDRWGCAGVRAGRWLRHLMSVL